MRKLKEVLSVRFGRGFGQDQMPLVARLVKRPFIGAESEGLPLLLCLL